jgi:signal transduction histidine kinase
MSNRLRKRKIILYYTVTIVLPCIVLGILAFRGIKNDQALLEKESRRVIQEECRNVLNEIVIDLTKVESNFLELTTSINSPQSMFFQETSLMDFLKKEELLRGIFSVCENGVISQLDGQILYHDKIDDQFESEIIGPSLEEVFEKGWNLEFRDKNFREAILYYRSELSKARNVNEEAITLISIARLQKKMNNKQGALDTHKTLLQEYEHAFIGEVLPIGIVSNLEKSQLYLELGDTIKHVESINSMLRGLKNKQWNIDQVTFENSLESVVEKIDELKNVMDHQMDSLQVSDSLLSDIDKGILKSDYLLSFSSISIENGLTVKSDSHYNLRNNIGDTYFIFLDRNESNNKWGFIYDQEVLLQKALKPRLNALSSEFNFEWSLVNERGEVLYETESLEEKLNEINIPLPNSMPTWELMISPKENLGFAAFVFRNEGVFFYIFLLILVILAIGLYFTLFIVNNELRVSQLKSNFISTVSHEFKSPLTGIRQMAEMLNDGRVPSDERKKKYYSAILQEGNRLSLMINNMLDFSKMEADQKSFHFEKGNLADVTEEMVSLLRNYWSGKGIEINFKLSEMVPDNWFDKESVKQVIQNLIDNACKYSGNSKVVNVEVSTEEEDIILSVKDFGIGIKEEDKKELFNRFFRSNDIQTQQVKGSGIGLTVVKQIVEKHGGDIHVFSEYGKGSVFKIRFPINKK